MTHMKKVFEEGDFVTKKEGHEFTGIVVATFNTLDGKPRVVVECLAQGARGLLFILRHDQLKSQLE